MIPPSREIGAGRRGGRSNDRGSPQAEANACQLVNPNSYDRMTYNICFSQSEPIIRCLDCQERREGHKCCVYQGSGIVDKVKSNDGRAEDDCYNNVSLRRTMYDYCLDTYRRCRRELCQRCEGEWKLSSQGQAHRLCLIHLVRRGQWHEPRRRPDGHSCEEE